MKKNKGFTLIELLAIIVILVIIAVITVPIILNIIEKSKRGTAIDSAYGYKESVEKYYARELYKNIGFDLNGTFTINNDGTLSDSENTYNVLISGKPPKAGYVDVEKGTVINGCIEIYEYAVRIEDKKVVSAEKGTCQAPEYANNTELNDPNPGIICGNEGVESYDDIDVCYIYSVEDLMEFSSLVNSGKNFQGKTVMLMNNLDINNNNSYVNSNTNAFGDANEDSTTSTSLKTELTTGKGFKPIGDSTNQFAGLFEGNAKKINNLYINRSDTDYVGLIAYNTGTIRGLIMEGGNVTGNNDVGIITGYSTGNVTGTMISGNVTGNDEIGLAVGTAYEGTLETVVQGNVISSYVEPDEIGVSSNIGGITGFSYSAIINAINKGGTITAPTAIAAGTLSGGGSIFSSTVASSSVTINSLADAESTEATIRSAEGPAQEDLGCISIMEDALDTYVGGDNNNDGYYYDNDASGNILLYKTSDRPLIRTMEGSGTSSDPYLITNYNQLKEAAYDTTKYYRLDADIDLTNEIPIILASSDNIFTGTFDGNTHSISNTTLKGTGNNGLFELNEGTIKGLVVNNINIITDLGGGTICGLNRGSITNVIVNNGNITGNTFLGLAVGHTGDDSPVEAVVSGNITSSFVSNKTLPGKAWVGGITGAMGYTTVKGLNLGGTISVIRGEKYRTVGFWETLYVENGTMSTGASETVVLAEEDNISANISNPNGKTYTTAELQTLDPYEEVGLNTSSETGEYRYALDSNYHPYLIKN